jgi:glycosyltransferase involved in cell wall biosynthesis
MDLYNVPIVSIACITYNQENFIKDAIEGFLMQKTTFPIEIIINDDASTDNTAEILRDYADKHPNLIIPIFQKENQYSKGFNPGVEFVFPLCKGKYIALCEGDDYWTDPYKLQKQVDFLEANNDYTICFHEVMILKNGEMLTDYVTRRVPEETDILDLAEGNYIHTTSVVFKNKLFDNFPEQFSKAPVGDYFLHMLNAQYGRIKKFNQVMAVYRAHNDGIHSKKLQAQKDDEWLTQLSLMIPCFEGDVKNILVNVFLQLAKSILLSEGTSANRKIEILQLLSEINPDYLIQIIDENEKHKVELNTFKHNLKVLIKSLKQSYTK